MVSSSGFTGFINDGYTRSAFVEAVPGIHDALTLSYRPCTTEERAQHGDDIASDKLATANKKAAALMGKQIQSWSIPGVKPDQAAMLKLNLNLFNRLYQIALGNDAGDPEPENTDKPLSAASSEGNDAGN